MIFHALKIALVSVVFVALTACATAATKEYAGPALPSNGTALVTTGPYTNIVEIDGRTITGLRAAVLPGRHTVVMEPALNDQPNREYLFYTWVTGSVEFTAEADRRYLVYVDFIPASGPADEQKGSGYVWVGYVVDRSTGEKVARTGQLPVRVEPRGFSTGFSMNPMIRR